MTLAPLLLGAEAFGVPKSRSMEIFLHRADIDPILLTI